MQGNFVERLGRGAGAPALLIISLAVAIMLARPGTPRTADAPPGEFSAERAMQHVYFLAHQPRPIGSIAHDVSRDYLADQFRSLGLETDIQSATVSYLRASRPTTSRFAHVENVIARLPGNHSSQSPDEPSGKALLLMAHYDSRPLTPGAGDDASGTAALLETARALASRGPFRNDIIFLLTDGEESGLFGAQAFFRNHPFAESVGTVLNFEARGSRGPMLMFQSSPGNAALIETLAEHSLQPAGNSLADAVYRRMRNDTDFSIPLEYNLQGMNFAFIDSFFDYHSPTDTPQNLSARSLQQGGNHALPVALALANADLPLPADSDHAFFNVLGSSGFVHYPHVVDWLVFVVALLVIGAAAVRAWRRDEIRVAGALRGLVASVVLVMFPALAVAAAFTIFSGTAGDDAVRGIIARNTAWLAAWCLLAIGAFHWLAARLRQRVSGAQAAVIAIVLLLGFSALGLSTLVGSILAVAVGAVAVFLLGNRISILEQRGGVLLLWIVLGIAMLLLEPSGAYLFTWPLLLAALVIGVGAITGEEPSPVYRVLVALPVLLTFGFLVYFVNLALGYGAPLVTMIPLLLLAVWLSVIFPVHHANASNWGLALLVTGLVIAPWLAVTSPFDARTPQPTQLFVVVDQVNETSWLASGDPELTAWQRPLLAGSDYRDAPDYWKAGNAPLHLKRIANQPAVGISLEVIDRQPRDAGEVVRLQMDAQPGVSRGRLEFSTAAVIRSARVNGEPIARPPLKAGDDWTWYWVGLPENGVTLELQLEGPMPEITSTSFRDGLPNALDIPQRPDAEMPQPYTWSDSTVFIQQFELGE